MAASFGEIGCRDSGKEEDGHGGPYGPAVRLRPYHNFASAAVGVALAIAFIRGIARRQRETIDNFWVESGHLGEVTHGGLLRIKGQETMHALDQVEQQHGDHAEQEHDGGCAR